MIVWELLAATLFSSIVGSLHCVGMCSPFAMLAMGPNKSDSGTVAGISKNRFHRLWRMCTYHLGRLFTYVMMAILVVTLSSVMLYFTGSASVGRYVGWAVGIFMIALGMHRLISSLTGRQKTVVHSVWMQHWTKFIIRLRKSYSGWNVVVAAFLWGATSTLLPCGWLYVFVIAASTAPSIGLSMALMIAFWLGTLPLLSIAAWSWLSLGPRMKSWMQPMAAVCIICFGVYTLKHRSEVEIDWTNFRAGPIAVHAVADDSHGESAPLSLQMVRQALEAELPCCVGDADRGVVSSVREEVEHVGKP